jgi:cytochrome c5
MKQQLVVAISLQLVFCGLAIASERMEDGRIAYEAKCASCHATGKNGAPATSNPEDWKNRSELWDAVLAEHAKSGYLGMPAKGGEPDTSDYDVEVAAEYMLNMAHPDFPQD